jgi:RNA polymerase sigma-70 factor (ECF subfamily)
MQDSWPPALPDEQLSTTTTASTLTFGFMPTHWSLVSRAIDDSKPGAWEALDELCRNYWPPLYGYLRHTGHNEPAAEDLTQGFFANLLSNHLLANVQREKGSFRVFLLRALKRYLTDNAEGAHTGRQGERPALVSLDEPEAHERYELESADTMTPDVLYDRHWAETVLERASARLKQEYQAAGKDTLIERFETLWHGGESSYSEAAKALGVSESGIRTAMLRMRRRFAELIREQVAQTVISPADTDEELRYLLRVISS